MKSYFRINGQRVNPVLGAIAAVLILIGLFLLARFIFRLLWLLVPVIVIATVIIDHRVVVNFFKWLFGLVRENALVGISVIVLSVLGFPLVMSYLLIKALLNRRVKQMEQQAEIRREGEYIEYEELEEEEPLELKELNPQPKKRDKDSDYDQYFE